MLPVGEIFCDHTFNCRGPIDRSTCIDLAEDISDKGLDFPIHVQPYTLNPKFKYRIVSGHRRFTAVTMNRSEAIPAVIRYDLSDETAAREANLRENIQRSDLTMLQEAQAINYFLSRGHSVSQVAKRLGKTSGWVEPRRKLLELPEFVHKAADEGIVTQNHIHQLHKYKGNTEKLSEMIREIKHRAEKGERGIVIKEATKIVDFAAIRRPKPHEVDEFLAVLFTNIVKKIPEEEYFASRCLAWVMGHISPAQLYVSLKRECERLGLDFNPPDDVRKLLASVTKV